MPNYAVVFCGPTEVALYSKINSFNEPDADFYFITPDAYDAALRMGLKPVYPEWLRKIRSFSISDDYQIRKEALNIEIESTSARCRMLSAPDEKVDWNYFNNYSTFWQIIASKKCALYAATYLRNYKQVFVISKKTAADWYFSSYLQPYTFCHALRSQHIDASIADIEIERDELTSNIYKRMPNIFDRSTIKKWTSMKNAVLVSAATVFDAIDKKKIFYTLQNKYPSSHYISYPQPMWSVFSPNEIFVDTIPVNDALQSIEKTQREQIIKYSDWLTQRTVDAITTLVADQSYVSDVKFKNQVDLINERHVFQVLTFHGWKELIQKNPPKMLAISWHDGGVNGPLLSACKDANADIYYFPHRRIFALGTASRGVVVTEWWQPSATGSLWGDENPCIFMQSASGGITTRTPQVATNWTIIHNGLHWGMLNSLSWSDYFNVVKKIEKIAAKYNKKVIHRLKPGGQTPIAAYCDLLGISGRDVKRDLEKTLDEVIEISELVIGIDDPSSALWHAMERGCPAILHVNRELPPEAMVNEDILKPYDDRTFVQTLESFLANPRAFQEYAERQQLRLWSLRDHRKPVIVH